MSKYGPTQTISLEELDDIRQQCAALHEDWQRFYRLAASPEAGDGVQVAFIQLQSRLSCDYPILSHSRKTNFGLASDIAKLVAHAGTLEAFSREARAGNGALVQEWHAINDTIARVRALLEEAREQARAGKPVKLPKEIAAPQVREPWPIEAIMRKAGIACAVLACCAVVFFLARPVFVETGLFKWLDKAYVNWQIRNGIPGIAPPGGTPPPR